MNATIGAFSSAEDKEFSAENDAQIPLRPVLFLDFFQFLCYTADVNSLVRN